MGRLRKNLFEKIKTDFGGLGRMTYYFTSEVPDLKTVEPGKTKLTENKMIAAFCLANPLEEPHYWFPCDFGSDGTVQYHELFKDAFKESCEGKKGFVYAAEAEEDEVSPSGEIVTVCYPKKELAVTDREEISDLYEWLMENEDMGRFRLYTFEQHTRQELLLWDNSILHYLAKNAMIDNPENPYAEFVQKKLSKVWEKYRKLCGR